MYTSRSSIFIPALVVAGVIAAGAMIVGEHRSRSMSDSREARQSGALLEIVIDESRSHASATAIDSKYHNPIGKFVLENLLVGTTSTAYILLQNTTADSTTFSDIELSCSCIQAPSFPSVIPAGQSELVKLHILPTAYQDRIDAAVTIHTSGGLYTANLIGEVRPPFDGWPVAARCERVGQSYRLRLIPEYARAKVCFAIRVQNTPHRIV